MISTYKTPRDLPATNLGRIWLPRTPQRPSKDSPGTRLGPLPFRHLFP